MSRILSRLGLKDFDEDFYALRKTFLTALDSNGVSDGKRKALAGHRDRDVTNVHYTAHDARNLKKAVDLVTAQLGITVVHSPRHGFPIIQRRSPETRRRVELTLDETGGIETLRLVPHHQTRPVVTYDARSLPADAGERARRLRQAVLQVKRLIDEENVEFPSQPVRLRAFESFLGPA